MKKIKFVTLHPPGTNVDLTKDEGQIPYTLSKNYNIDSTIVTCHIDNKTANMDSVNGLKVKHFPLIINYAITGIVYLLLNAKKIDWLNIYFAGRQAYLWTKIYKFFNRKGHVYLKLDMDYRSCDLYDKNEKERDIFKKNTKIVDIVSVESMEIKNRIQKYSEKDILIISDGIAELKYKPEITKNREDVILTVGRLGTEQKATDILLTAFANSANQHNWKLKLIGTIEDTFMDEIEKFYNIYPQLKERVFFVGEIKEREQLYEEYCRAKVFALPSRWESFGISCAEALCCGCHLIVSDSIPPAREMTNNEKYGKIVKTESIKELEETILAATRYTYFTNEICEISSYANNLFSWDRICDVLYKEIKRINDEGYVK